MKAYVVTDGCYSDYRIIGVALDYGIAEAIAKMKCEDGGTIETYDICEDKGMIEAAKDYIKKWRFIFDTHGRIKGYEHICWSNSHHAPYVKIYGNQHDVYVYENDLDKAKKIAIDTRSMELAKMYGINIS